MAAASGEKSASQASVKAAANGENGGGVWQLANGNGSQWHQKHASAYRHGGISSISMAKAISGMAAKWQYGAYGGIGVAA